MTYTPNLTSNPIAWHPEWTDYGMDAYGNPYSRKHGDILPLATSASFSGGNYLAAMVYHDSFDRGVRLISLHRLAYECWKGPIPDGLEVDHIDGVTKNNAISNLQLLTKWQNRIKSFIASYRVGECLGVNNLKGRWVFQCTDPAGKRRSKSFEKREDAVEAAVAFYGEHFNIDPVKRARAGGTA